MATAQTCQECGNQLPAGSPPGCCPFCMLGLALAERDSSKDAADVEELGPNRGADAELRKERPKLRGSAILEDHLDGYKLLEEIGHGGCGVVYMAEQERPVRRRVALKVIKVGMDTREVVARFEAERQALARMDHPNIARVLDAGATRSGRPFFAMELVGGIKITDYCDRNELSTEERLRLFVQVCRAVQHAHQKGIIHRDIKPSNVLVAHHDGLAVPKVIDFGIAKATQGRLIDQTLFTAFEQFIGTPVYMSPEQADPGGLDVDTRSDIYSLGVLLYELLTGKTPFDLPSSNALGVEAMRRTVLDKEPVKPSTRLRDMFSDQLTTIARARQTAPPRLVKMIRGDLDWIVMKCLEKDRARRYETANGLAMDLERYLQEEPVLARPPSAVYRIQKLIRRNRLATFSAAAISLILVLATLVSARQAVKARKAELEQIRLRKEAQMARTQATEELWGSYLAQARARRLSGEAGRNFESLAALEKASLIRPSLELRNEAIASMVQADIRWLGGKKFPATLGAVAPDLTGPRYAICDEVGRVTIRQFSDDRILTRLPATNSPAVGVSFFSPNGTLVLVSYADAHLRVWDWEQGICRLDFAGPAPCDFAPDGEQLAACFPGRLVFFDLREGAHNSMAKCKSFEVESGDWGVRFSPDGKRLALFGAQTNLILFDVTSGVAIRALPHDGAIHRVAWSPDARLLATTCTDNLIHLWEVETGRELNSWPGSQSLSLAFNPEGTWLISSGWDGKTRIWDFRAGKALVSIYKAGFLMGFQAGSGRLLQIPWDAHGLDVFELKRPEGLRTMYAHELGRQPPSGVATFSRAGSLLAFPAAGGVRLWDLTLDREIGVAGHDQSSIINFASSDSQLILADPAGVESWPLKVPPAEPLNRENALPILGSPERVLNQYVGTGGGVTPDGRHVFLIVSNRCRIFGTSGFLKEATTGVQPGMRYSASNPDGSLIATGAWHMPGVIVWNGRTGEQVKSFETSDSTSVAFSPDGRYLVGGTAERYIVWEAGSWAVARTIPQPEDNDFVPIMSFSRDSRILAGTHSRNVVRLHNGATGEVIADLQPPDAGAVTWLSFNQDGSRLAVCEGQAGTRVWDLLVIRSNLTRMRLNWELKPSSSRQAAHAKTPGLAL